MKDGESQLGVDWTTPADKPYDRATMVERYLVAAVASVCARLKKQGLSATGPPPMPPPHGLVDSFIHNDRYRVLVQYDLHPIIGAEDEPDENGDTVYIYGDPCWRARVDVLAIRAATPSGSTGE